MLIYQFVWLLVCSGLLNGILNLFFSLLALQRFSFFHTVVRISQVFFYSFYRRKMAQTIARASSIQVEESLESRMVVTFLMSGLESMVSREVEKLNFCAINLGICRITFPWAAGKVDCYICTVLCVVQPAVTLPLLVINHAISNLASCCGVVVLKIILPNKLEICVDCLGTAWLEGKSVFWSLSYVMWSE